MCFTVGRIKFWAVDGRSNKSTRDGQAFLYYGDNTDEFGGLCSHHLVDCLATTLPEGGVHFPDGVGVKRMTRAMDVAGSVLARRNKLLVSWDHSSLLRPSRAHCTLL